MNKTIQSKKEITNRTEYWDYTLSKILNTKIFDETIKFHQASSIIKRDNGNNPYNLDTLIWLRSVENSDVLPNLYLAEYMLSPSKENNFQGSIRDLHTEKSIDFQTFSNIIHKAFGRDTTSTSKRYPSAGALYPILPIIYILGGGEFETLDRGVYVYDSYKNSLRLIKQWNKDEYKDFIQIVNPWDNKLYSNYLIGYAIDMKRAIAKYKRRGYRHALIEVGVMVQSLKESIIEENQNLGEFCWSGFDDNALAHITGLNPRTCPITLLQWFGIRRDLS
jgi:SagB-type dehydrogenase family enzyme